MSAYGYITFNGTQFVTMLVDGEPVEIDLAQKGVKGPKGFGGGNGNGNGNGNLPEIEIVKLPSYVAPLNASAVETPGLAGNLSSTILERYKQVDEPLRAAALAR